MSYVVVWGLRKCQSDELAVSSINPAVLSVTSRAEWMMNHVDFVKCVFWPSDVHAAESIALIGCWSSLIGR